VIQYRAAWGAVFQQALAGGVGTAPHCCEGGVHLGGGVAVLI
jgi:hypothetical protein